MTPPDMSVVLPTDSTDRIRAVIAAIREAPPECALEIVVVAPPGVRSGFDPATTVVEVPSVYPLSLARAAGIRGASASYVFIGETHSFPRRGMFDALLSAHRKGAAVAVPALENENPGSLVSWAGFINGYAPWSRGREAGDLTHAPLFNASYDRAFLLDMGNDLEKILTSGEDMMSRLRSAGRRAVFEPDALIGHVNIAPLGPWLRQRIVAGRTIASVRSTSWGITRRLAYALASPLIPAVLIRRHRQSISRTVRSNDVSAALWPVLGIGMVFQAFGEALGYALGRNRDSELRYDTFEVEQMNYRS